MLRLKPLNHRRLLLLPLLVAVAGCTGRDPIRNLATQDGNAGPQASAAGNIAPSEGGARIALGLPVWSSPLPPPGPIVVGRRR